MNKSNWILAVLVAGFAAAGAAQAQGTNEPSQERWLERLRRNETVFLHAGGSCGECDAARAGAVPFTA